MADGIDVTGHCYCGEVRYRVRIPSGERPIFTAYCHCDSCRRAHAAPLYHVACVEERHFEITSGTGHLVDFNRPGVSIHRVFCGRCGSKILNRFPGWEPGGRIPLAFFPDTLDEATQHALPELLRPMKNNRADECVLDLDRLRELTA